MSQPQRRDNAGEWWHGVRTIAPLMRAAAASMSARVTERSARPVGAWVVLAWVAAISGDCTRGHRAPGPSRGVGLPRRAPRLCRRDGQVVSLHPVDRPGEGVIEERIARPALD